MKQFVIRCGTPDCDWGHKMYDMGLGSIGALLFLVSQALPPEARSSGVGHGAARAFGPGTLDAEAYQGIGGRELERSVKGFQAVTNCLRRRVVRPSVFSAIPSARRYSNSAPFESPLAWSTDASKARLFAISGCSDPIAFSLIASARRRRGSACE